MSFNGLTVQHLNRNSLNLTAILFLSGIMGCGSPNEAARSGLQSLSVGSQTGTSNIASGPASISQGPTGQIDVIDAGVIFADRSSYLCFPIERLGLDSSAKIVSIDTSCECVQARVVQYANGPAGLQSAILLEFTQESADNDSAEELPVDLCVTVTLKSETNDCWKFSLNLRHIAKGSVRELHSSIELPSASAQAMRGGPSLQIRLKRPEVNFFVGSIVNWSFSGPLA